MSIHLLPGILRQIIELIQISRKALNRKALLGLGRDVALLEAEIFNAFCAK